MDNEWSSKVEVQNIIHFKNLGPELRKEYGGSSLERGVVRFHLIE